MAIRSGLLDPAMTASERTICHRICAIFLAVAGLVLSACGGGSGQQVQADEQSQVTANSDDNSGQTTNNTGAQQNADDGVSNDTNGSNNLIPDGGFESGNGSAWQAWGPFFVATGNAMSGAFAANIPSGSGGGLFVAVQAGTDYRLSAWGKTSGFSWARLQLKFLDAGWNEISAPYLSASYFNSWSEQEIRFTSPANAVRAQVGIWNSSGATLYLDDVSLTAIATGTDDPDSNTNDDTGSDGGDNNSADGNDGNGGNGGNGGAGNLTGIAIAPDVSGQRYYVSPGGSGVSKQRSSPGSVNDTVRKICDATESQIGGGDAIVFLDGQYQTSALNLQLAPDSNQPGHGGQAVAMVNRLCAGPRYIYLMAENRYGAYINNDVTWTNHSGGFDIRNSSYIWIEGFVIQGLSQSAVPFESGVSVGYGSHHAVVRYNKINRVGGGGIVVNGGTHIRLENNEIVGAANWHPFCASGISFFEAENRGAYPDDSHGYSNYILGNRVFGTRTRVDCDADADPANGTASFDGNCIVLDQFAKHNYQARSLIEGNLCVDNGGGGVHMFNSGNADVINNTIFASGQVSLEGGLSISCTDTSVPTRNVRFANNLVHTWSGTALTATDFGRGCLSNIEHRHNIFVNQNPNPGNISGTTVALSNDAARLDDCTSSWNLQSVGVGQVGWLSPATNASALDFRLTEQAIGRNRGSCIVPPRATVDNQEGDRINGTQVDIGAFEY